MKAKRYNSDIDALLQSIVKPSPYLFSGNIIQTSDEVAEHWWDDGGVASIDGVLYTFGGWYTPNGTDVFFSNKIYQSGDNGVTWSESENTLPFSGDAFVVLRTTKYVYIIGCSNAHTDLQQTVYRTIDLNNFEVLTVSAGWRERYGLGGCADDEGNLYIMGGQNGANTIEGNPNDIWKSTDSGFTWFKIANDVNVNGEYFLGQIITKCVQYFNGRIYVVGGGLYMPPPFRVDSNKVFSAHITDLNTWRKEEDIPANNPKVWTATSVWDTKIWVMGGYGDGGNSNEIYYFDGVTWYEFPYTYTNNNPAEQIGTTHATNLVVHKDKLFRILGNTTNSCYELSRSNYLPKVILREPVDELEIGDLEVTGTTRLNGKVVVGNDPTISSEAKMHISGVGDLLQLEFNDTIGRHCSLDANNVLHLFTKTLNGSKFNVYARQLDVGTIIGRAGNGYPAISYNLNFGDLPNTYTYKAGDTAYLIELGKGDAIRFSTAPAGLAGNTPTFTERFVIGLDGKISIKGLPEYADNAAALGGSLVADNLYKSGDFLKIVH